MVAVVRVRCRRVVRRLAVACCSPAPVTVPNTAPLRNARIRLVTTLTTRKLTQAGTPVRLYSTLTLSVFPPLRGPLSKAHLPETANPKNAMATDAVEPDALNDSSEGDSSMEWRSLSQGSLHPDVATTANAPSMLFMHGAKPVRKEVSPTQSR